MLHYAQDLSDIPVSRMAFGILLKAVNSWGSQGESSGAAAAAALANGKNGVSNGSSGSGGGGDGTEEKLEAPGFYQFMYEHILRITFEVPMKPTFDLQDGQSVLVLGEIAGLQKAIASKQGDTFLSYLNQVYLPSIHCPPELAQEYIHALQQLDAKQFKKYFQVRSCISRLDSTGRVAWEGRSDIPGLGSGKEILWYHENVEESVCLGVKEKGESGSECVSGKDIG